MATEQRQGWQDRLPALCAPIPSTPFSESHIKGVWSDDWTVYPPGHFTQKHCSDVANMASQWAHEMRIAENLMQTYPSLFRDPYHQDTCPCCGCLDERSPSNWHDETFDPLCQCCGAPIPFYAPMVITIPEFWIGQPVPTVKSTIVTEELPPGHFLPGWTLLRPLRLDVEVGGNGTWVVSESQFFTYGTGDCLVAAIDDYKVTLTEYFDIMRERVHVFESNRVIFDSLSGYLRFDPLHTTEPSVMGGLLTKNP